MTSTLLTKTRRVTKKLIRLPSWTFAEEIALAGSTAITVPAGIFTRIVAGGVTGFAGRATAMAGGPYGTIFIAIRMVSGTPRIFKSRRTGGKTSNSQLEVTILAIISPGLMPSLTMRRTSLL